jgi:hypothetical protein
MTVPNSGATQTDTTDRLLIGVFSDTGTAQEALDRLNQRGFPLDMVSLLGKGGSSGDDALGIYYPGIGQRMKGWGAMGAFWGGLWGLVSGAAGMFLIPGLGPLLAAGPVVEALVGAAAGAGITGGVMAGAAALSQLGVALHRMGVPEDELHRLHDAVAADKLVLLLRLGQEEVERWRPVIADAGAEGVMDYPYVGALDVLRGRPGFAKEF